MGVAIHLELYFEILRPMVKKKLKSDIPFLSYGKKTAIFVVIKKAIFGCFFNLVSLIELNPSLELRIDFRKNISVTISSIETNISVINSMTRISLSERVMVYFYFKICIDKIYKCEVMQNTILRMKSW